MSDSTYSLSFTAMDTAIEDARQLATTFRTTLEQMNSQLNTSLASWTGPAQDEYAATYTKVYNTALQMPDALNQVQATLGQIQEGYSTTEVNVGRAFS